MTPIVTTLQASSPTRGRVAVPPSAADSLTPNLPSGLTLIGDTTFPTSTSPSGWTCSTYAAPSIAGPYAGTSHEAVYDAGDDQGGAITGRSIKPASYGGAAGFRRAYVAFAFKKSANFQENVAGTKVLYPTRTSSQRDFMLLARPIGGVTSGEYRFGMTTQPPGGSGSSATGFDENVNGYSSGNRYVCNNDEWIRVEIDATYSTPGVADGVFKMWLARWDGSAWAEAVQVMDHSNVWYGGSVAPQHWTIMGWDNFMGGASSGTIPADQQVYYNRVHVSIGDTV
jgi:hypothetical protein